jgi:hypothetical protein
MSFDPVAAFSNTLFQSWSLRRNEERRPRETGLRNPQERETYPHQCSIRIFHHRSISTTTPSRRGLQPRALQCQYHCYFEHVGHHVTRPGALRLRKGRVSKLIAAEFKKVGIRVNCIAPSYFPSEMTMKESDEKNKSEMLKEKI